MKQTKKKPFLLTQTRKQTRKQKKNFFVQLCLFHLKSIVQKSLVLIYKKLDYARIDIIFKTQNHKNTRSHYEFATLYIALQFPHTLQRKTQKQHTVCIHMKPKNSGFIYCLMFAVCFALFCFIFFCVCCHFINTATVFSMYCLQIEYKTLNLNRVLVSDPVSHLAINHNVYFELHFD